MKPRYAFFLTGIAVLALLSMHCVIPNAGNGSDVGNSMVAGVLYNTDGSFAKDAIVQIRPKNFLPDISRLGLAKQAAEKISDTASVLTNDSGQYHFGAALLDTGTYIIEATSGSNGVFIDSVNIITKDWQVRVPPDTLKPMGAIKGTISLSAGGDPGNIIICALGIDGTASVQPDGSFTFSNLPEGVYTLKTISKLGNYGSLDTGGIKVTSGETTNIATIAPPNFTEVMGSIDKSGYGPPGFFVYIRKKNNLTDSLMRTNGWMNDIGTFMTMNSGNYSFDSLKNDTYVIEVMPPDGSYAVLIDSVIVTGKDPIVNVPTATLKPAGGIKGVVELSSGGNLQEFYVYAFGINRRAALQADGSFAFSPLAEGVYHLRLLSMYGNYGVLDVENVKVISDSTTDVTTLAPSLDSTVLKNGAVITGVLYNPDGSTVKLAKVYISTSDAANGLPDFWGSNRFTTCQTNQSGKFLFYSLKSGTYSIETENGNNAILIDSVIVTGNSATIPLPQDTLKPKGAIKGTLKFQGNQQIASTLIYIDGHQAQFRSDGGFISYVAQGKHKIRITSTGSCAGALDTSNILVNAAETTNVGTMTLPCFQGSAFAPIYYDTLNQLVTLRWSRFDTTLIKGINIYRRNIDSTGESVVPLNLGLVTDTFYIDSTGVQDQTYEYRIAPVDKNYVEGLKSAAITVKIATNFVLDTVYNVATRDIDFAKNGDIYMWGDGIQVFDSTMRLKRTIGDKDFLFSIDEFGRVIAISQSESTPRPLFVFDSLGTAINMNASFPGLMGNSNVVDIMAKDSLIFTLAYDSIFSFSVMVSSYDGKKQRTWNCPPDTDGNMSSTFSKHIAAGDANEIIVNTGGRITRYDYSGNVLSSFHSYDLPLRGCLSFDKKRQLLYFLAEDYRKPYNRRYTTMSTLFAVNKENAIVAMYKVPDYILNRGWEMGVSPNGTIFITSGAGNWTGKLRPLF